MRILTVPCAILFATALAVGCSEQSVPTASTSPGSTAQLQSGNSGPSANGQALFTFEGAKQTFAFHAREQSNGAVSGSFEVKAHAVDIRLHGNIDCLSISGNTAIMSGVVTHSNEPLFPVGTTSWFKVVDNGEGANALADEWTDLFVLVGFDCTVDPGFALIPIEAGNIQVKP